MSNATSKMAASIIDQLIQIRIFDKLDSDELATVARYMNVVDVNAGDYVFREGKIGNYVCFVAAGTLEVLKNTETGHTTVLNKLGVGSSIGEMAILDSFPRSASVRAKTKSTLITLSSRGFEEILDQYPRIGIKILQGITRLLSQNLRYTSARLADYMLPVT